MDSKELTKGGHENEDMEISLLDGVLLNGEKKMLFENTKELPLKYEYYTFVDTSNLESKLCQQGSRRNTTCKHRLYNCSENKGGTISANWILCLLRS